MKKVIPPVILVILAFVFVLIFSSSTSPLYVWEGWDSDIFKEIGLAISRGKLLYVDIFDHKGPNIFLLNALGQILIPGRTGIFVLQMLMMSVVFVFLYKTASLFLRPILSFVAVLITAVIYSGIYCGGNLCEEWSLVAIVISLYVALRYILSQSSRRISPHPVRYSILYAVCFSYVFYFRPNDAVAAIGGIMLGIFIYLIYTGQYKNAISNAAGFVGVFILLSVPYLAYFASKDALEPYFYGMIKFNSMYTEGIPAMLKACLGKKKLIFFLMFLAVAVLAYNTEHRKILFVLVPVFIFGWILTGSMMYSHYGIPYIPVFLLFWVLLFKQKNLSVAILSLAIFYCSSYSGGQLDYLWGVRYAIPDRIKHIKSKDYENRRFYDECDKLISQIPESERDSIWNYNLWGGPFPYRSIFFHNGLVQCNKVVHFPHYVIDPPLKKEDDITVHKPQWMLLSHIFDDKFDMAEDYEYIENNYMLVAQTDRDICDIELYRRKDICSNLQ